MDYSSLWPVLKKKKKSKELITLIYKNNKITSEANRKNGCSISSAEITYQWIVYYVLYFFLLKSTTRKLPYIAEKGTSVLTSAWETTTFLD